MIRTRIAGEEITLGADEWRLWVEDGRIPPEALVLTEDGRWMPAGELTLYDEIRRAAAPPPPHAAPQVPSVFSVILPRRGLSATQLLFLVNLLVGFGLYLLWRDTYSTRLWDMSRGWWQEVHGDQSFGLMVPTLFLHAGPGHLLRNLVALLAAGAAAEYLTGRGWTLIAYLVTGLAGAAFSYAGHQGPPLSVGASGAVFGLVGVSLGFLVRRYRSLPFRQQWKTRRVYLPLFVIFVGQSLLHADWWAHSGGFVAGVVFGLVVPAHQRIRDLRETLED